MRADYVFIGLFAVVSILFPIVAVAVAALLRPKRPDPVKETTYECGLDTRGPTWVRFRAQYYLYALLFVVFAVEVAFLYPWAVAYNQLPLFAIIEMFVFLAILILGLAYAWRKGVLRWL